MRCLPHLSLHLPPFPPSPLPSLGKHRNVKWAGEDLPSRPAASPSLPTHSPSRLPRPQLYLFTVALVSLHPTSSFLPSFAPPALIAFMSGATLTWPLLPRACHRTHQSATPVCIPFCDGHCLATRAHLRADLLLGPSASFTLTFVLPLISPPIFSPPVLTRPPSAASPLSPSRSPSLVTSTFFLSVLS